MTVNRRDFLRQGGVAFGAGLVGAGCAPPESAPPGAPPQGPPPPASGEAARAAPAVAPAVPAAEPRLDTWEGVRALFPLTHDLIFLAGLFFTSHPTPVREAIAAHQRGFDENPLEYLEPRFGLEDEVRKVAGEFLAVSPGEIALTDSTTMGLGVIYGSLSLKPGDEILTTTHDHFVTEFALRYCAERTGAKVRRIKLYDRPEEASADRIAEAIGAAVTPKTRVVAVTWVHSVSGVKLPLRRIADAIAKRNAGRDEKDRALLCVDGVHGFGIDDFKMSDLGCDFFAAGCHKWLFGPRGTGIAWGSAAAWKRARPSVPGVDFPLIGAWIRGTPVDELPYQRSSPGALFSPAGFHSFEYRWALAEAFRLHQRIGRARIAERVHALNRQFKEGLRGMPNVTLRTPLSDELSAGISCFEVKGQEADAVVKRLREHKIVASVPPYPKPFVRVTPGLYNTPEEIETTLRHVRAVAAT
jgi:selenocysteine lyase/cysteine desulfurase